MPEPGLISPTIRIAGLIWGFPVGAEGIGPPTLRQPADTFPAQILLYRGRFLARMEASPLHNEMGRPCLTRQSQ